MRNWLWWIIKWISRLPTTINCSANIWAARLSSVLLQYGVWRWTSIWCRWAPTRRWCVSPDLLASRKEPASAIIFNSCLWMADLCVISISIKPLCRATKNWFRLMSNPIIFWISPLIPKRLTWIFIPPKRRLNLKMNYRFGKYWWLQWKNRSGVSALCRKLISIPAMRRKFRHTPAIPKWLRRLMALTPLTILFNRRATQVANRRMVP